VAVRKSANKEIFFIFCLEKQFWGEMDMFAGYIVQCIQLGGKRM
jgi:hypothetical protein